uniref:Gypsy retrotransposon integrase-like protein 1 n=1 Tax=Cyprinus carpio TaxID=7962 RepID=A0A8C1V487_CYPCA
MRNLTNVDELVEAIELVEATQHREVGERVPPFPRRVVQERRTPEGTQRPGSRPAVPVPQDEPMPTEAPHSPGRAWVAGCAVHAETPKQAPRAKVNINGRPFLALLDSGSTITLVRPTVLPPRPEPKARLPLKCVHGDTRDVLARRVTITAPPGAWPVEVGIVRDLPVPVLLGRDWPGFDRLLASASHDGNRPQRQAAKKPRRRPVLLASDSPREGESAHHNPNLYFDLFQQVTGAGAFAREQHEDDRLKHCWAQVRVTDGKELQPAPHPTPHFMVRNGLLYCVAQRRGEEKTLLVVPRSKTEAVLELAHAHPMAGHLGAQNTVQRIRDRFHWPGFCQACPTCQRTSPRTPPPSPLIPLPIIEVPFERIGMDLVGPLPKSAWGHEHILVILDYATRYPEAIPLSKATAKAITQELFLLSSRVGIPSQILTDQGTPFMSRVMADICKLLQIKQLHRPMAWSSDLTRSSNRCCAVWLPRTSETGIRCCPMFYSESKRYPRLPPALPHLSSSSAGSPTACLTSPEKLGSNSLPSTGPWWNMSGKCGSGSTGSCPSSKNPLPRPNKPSNGTIIGRPSHFSSSQEITSWS